MHRRAFIASLAATTVLPRSLSAQTPTASPAATPVAGSVRPSPVDLGSDITLVDYRIHPGESLGIIGEVRNDSGQMIDAPVVSISWPRPGQEDGFSWLSPIIPVIDAGGSVPVYGSVPDGEDAEAMVAEPSFALCSPAEPGEFTTLQSAMTLELTLTTEQVEETSYNARGTIANTGPDIVRNLVLLGVIRDREGRIAGTTQQVFYTAFGVTSRAFSIWAGINLNNKTNPYVLIDNADYSAEIYAGTRGPLTLPGCQFGLPWE